MKLHNQCVIISTRTANVENAGVCVSQVRFVFEAFRKLRPGVPMRSLHGGMKQMKRMGVFYEYCQVGRWLGRWLVMDVLCELSGWGCIPVLVRLGRWGWVGWGEWVG